MATKLLRLTSDEKKEAKRDGQWTAGQSYMSLDQVLDYLIRVHHTLYVYMYSILAANQIQTRLIYQTFISLATIVHCSVKHNL